MEGDTHDKVGMKDRFNLTTMTEDIKIWSKLCRFRHSNQVALMSPL